MVPTRSARVAVVATSAVCLVITCVCPVRASKSVHVSRTVAAGVPMIVLTVNLNDPNVKVTGVVLPNGRADSFQSMVSRTHPTAAVTGTYFGTDNRIAVGDIVIGGELAHTGGVGTGFCVTDQNECAFVRAPRYHHFDWSDYDFVCCAGPRLVSKGRVCLNARGEGFRDPDLLGNATRLAVGVAAHNRLIFAATRDVISLNRLATAMRALHCREAINLDAGASLGVYNGGNMLMTPGRKLTNLILIYDDRDRYERYRDRLTASHSHRKRVRTARR